LSAPPVGAAPWADADSVRASFACAIICESWRCKPGIDSRSRARPSCAGAHSTDHTITTASTALPHVSSAFSRAVRASQKPAHAFKSSAFIVRS
jgi:hypothetical protein